MSNSRKISKRIISLTLSLALLLSACLMVPFSVSAATVTATDSHVVYEDDFTDETLSSAWRWAGRDSADGSTTQGLDQYKATVSDGKLHLPNVNASSQLQSFIYTADRKYVNQRAAITFDAIFGLKPVLYVRANQKYAYNYQSAYGYYVIFNCNQNGSVSLDVSKRIYDQKATVTSLGSAGKADVTSGAKYRLEMVAQGTNPTLVSVYLYKVLESGDQVVCHNSFVDNEAMLQTAGVAGIGGMRTSAAAAENTEVIIDKFEYTSTDNVTGNYYITSGTTGSKTFGQVVMLDPTKKYILSATARYKDYRNGEDVNPLWIEYWNSSNAFTRVLTARASLTSNRTEEQATAAGIEYNEYYTVSYVFDMTTLTDNKVDSTIGNKTRVIVGMRTDNSTVTADDFTHFCLYATDDANKTNLLVNPDFKMGLYGWYDTVGSVYNYSMEKESVGTASNGIVTFNGPLNDYEYYNLFKNGNYTINQGDATGDGDVDIRDLVQTKKIAVNVVEKYNVAVDYDTNGTIAAADLGLLRKQILGVSLDAATQVNVDAAEVLAAQSAATTVALGSDYTADYK